MLTTRTVVSAFFAAVMVLGASAVSAQNYPNKPIRIVTSLAGASADFVARIIAQGISGPLGQQVIVENRPANIAAEIVANTQPDGYTLGLYGQSLWIRTLLEKVSYDVLRDFTPITLANMDPTILIVQASLPVKSVKELIALAKARPGELNYSSAGNGSVTHLTAELLNALAGIKTVQINYKGGAPALAAVLAGEAQFSFGTVGAVAPIMKSGKVRALGVTSTRPSVLAPGLPPVAETVPGYEYINKGVIMAPAKTPVAIISRLNREMVRVVTSPEIKEKLLSAGLEAVGSSPKELGDLVKAEITRMGKVIKDAGIRAD